MQLASEQNEMLDSVDKLVSAHIAPIAAAIDRDNAVPRSLVEICGDMGLLQFRVPVDYHGPGGSAFDACVIRERIARTSAVCSLFAGQNSIIIQPLLVHGTREQKERFLPRIAEGRSLAAIAITEADAGSDVRAMQTRATLRGDRYVISGRKSMISHGSGADLMLLFAKSGNSHQISAFLFDPRQVQGVQVGPPEPTMGLRGHPIHELTFENMELPVESRIGAEGDGFLMLTRTLTLNRPMVGAMAVGLAQGALDVATAYARERRQFGKPIIEHQAIQVMLADMAIQVEAARSLVYRCVRQLDDGDLTDFQSKSSMAKCFASDVAMQVTTDAVQVLGGYGYTNAFPVERMMRDAKITQIFEGTNQIQRLIIAREMAR
jgi:alkylation response protein AidB-like acyl-CoA dehydrogenase